MTGSGDTAILMPAFNEAETIAEVVRNVSQCGLPLVVDDGSTDGTAELAEGAGATVIRLSPNRGYEGALEAGFEAASRLDLRRVVTYDADGQFELAGLKAVIAAMASGNIRLVLGQRPEAARFGEWLFNVYTRLRFGVGDILCGLKGYDVSLYREIGRFGTGRSVGTELALAALRRGEAFDTVPVTVLPRQSGPSRFGQGFRANRRLLTALCDAVKFDLFGRKSA